jgi:cell division septal protein FtsQ
MPQKKNKKILIYIFLFLIIGTLNNKNLNPINFMDETKVYVTGLDNKNNLEIKDNLNFLKLYNLFFLDKKKIKDILSSNSLVEKYSVFKKYPSTLNVQITKTIFLAKVKKNSDLFFLGSNGKLTKLTNIEQDIPFIFGDYINKNFFELKDIIDNTSFDYKEIKNLFFFKSGRWDIETNNGILIKLPKNNLKESLELLIDFLSKNHTSSINKIDLRQRNQIIVNGK